ncbi:MAG: hypothetical protein JW820_08680 [Spirochaetales bacterium]|nr:hypothetical protein [Spirochaetales bacterium]
MEVIRIDLPYAEIEQRAARWNKALRFEQADRVPVLHYIGSRYWLPLIGYGTRFREYLGDPATMLKCQLLGQKWILENVRSDFHKIVLYPDFMWVEDTNAFGADIVIPEDDSPWVARPHMLEKDPDLGKLRKVDYVNTGLHGKMLEFYREMKKRAQEYRIEFSDGKTLEAVDCVYPGGGGILGLAGLAGDLCGVEGFSMSFYDRPEWVKELLEIVTDKAIDWLDAVVELQEGDAAFCADVNPKVLHVGDDGTAQMSPDQIEQFMLGPHKRLADHIRKLGYKVQAHNCGKADHLLEFWMNDVGIDRYIGFSYQTDKKALRQVMGGRVILMGGVDTVKLHEGTSEEVMEDCRVNLEIFGDCPGYVLQDGHNVPPETPVENLNVLVEAAARYAHG